MAFSCPTTKMAQTSLKIRLQGLECHFTWKLDDNRSKLQSLRESMIDISSSEGVLCSWTGHLYNFLAYLHHALGSTEDALQCLKKAEEAIHLNSPDDVELSLVVHYGNLAWVHYHQGELTESQTYVEKVGRLLRDNPSPCPGVVWGERAWTLNKFDVSKKAEALDCFRKALKGDPQNKVLRCGYAMAFNKSVENKNITPKLRSEMLEHLRIARELDPEDLYITVMYLQRLAESGQVEEARKLSKEVIEKPLDSFGGFGILLYFLRDYVSHDSSIDLARRTLERHPNSRQLKRHLGKCYKWKIFSQEEKRNPMRHILIENAVSLYEEVVALYPKSLAAKLELSAMYKESGRVDRADKMFEDLLLDREGMEPQNLQKIYNWYAQHLFYAKQDASRSIDFHKKAVEIMLPTDQRDSSIHVLLSIVRNGGDRAKEIVNFLDGLDGEGAVGKF
ncbi:interferon-induced protein with tetratricopeptide repeats 1-like [Oncorhynchus mykiss]|uniref:interferon-induced protein with tetratricopeptide repeats 1-like n=1 Tax=Oncorhynchus mykiss TaxID=8022 RepID=UPI0018778071|nr:interferon-induced protein with tetratricopeptide repeats 1-like [Oncorhynchus mykiss]